MRGSHQITGAVVCAAMCALIAAPATAERYYVPMIGAAASDGSPLRTEIWVDAKGRPAAARFQPAASAASMAPRSVALAAGGRLLGQLAAPGEVGLVEIDATLDSAVSAFLTTGRGEDDLAELPVLSLAEAYAAGAEPGIRWETAGELDRLLVGAANLGEHTASCTATLLGGDSEELVRIPFEVPAKSLAREEAGEWTPFQVSAATVTCDQPFHPIGLAVEKSGLRPVVAMDYGPNAPCQIKLTLTKQPNGTYTAATPTVPNAIFHDATKAKPKGVVCLELPAGMNELRVGKVVFSWTVSLGQWTKPSSYLHNMAYFFLERYRSGVVGNINAAGPKKSFVKFMQNVNMPRGTNTNAKKGIVLQPGSVYHFVYTFDAHNKRAELQVRNSAQVELVNIGKEVKPGNNQTLILKAYSSGGASRLGVVCEFGNFVGQHPPEAPSLGTKYSTFSVLVHPKT